VDFPLATGIEQYAFDGCTSLITADFPLAISVGNYAFDGCTSLTTVDLSSATSIGNYAFNGCTSLTTVDLSSAATIGDHAFDGCTGLATVDLSSVTNIGNQVFSNTGGQGLTVTVGEVIPMMGIQMFVSVTTAKIVTVKVPAGATGYGPIPAIYDNTDNTSYNWGNGFRGGGWNGSTMSTATTINSSITVNIDDTP
jgi:hypothetical protein